MAATARRAIQFKPCYDLLAYAKQILFQFSSICILCPGNQESAGPSQAAGTWSHHPGSWLLPAGPRKPLVSQLAVPAHGRMDMGAWGKQAAAAGAGCGRTRTGLTVCQAACVEGDSEQGTAAA
uniref:Uncharacterized protein n=1 Tax=Zea mays TaxID=4577 RepID=Q5GAU5_MAIZE|nr:unknown [Zea mays]